MKRKKSRVGQIFRGGDAFSEESWKGNTREKRKEVHTRLTNRFTTEEECD